MRESSLDLRGLSLVEGAELARMASDAADSAASPSPSVGAPPDGSPPVPPRLSPWSREHAEPSDHTITRKLARRASANVVAAATAPVALPARKKAASLGLTYENRTPSAAVSAAPFWGGGGAAAAQDPAFGAIAEHHTEADAASDAELADDEEEDKRDAERALAELQRIADSPSASPSDDPRRLTGGGGADGAPPT